MSEVGQGMEQALLEHALQSGGKVDVVLLKLNIRSHRWTEHLADGVKRSAVCLLLLQARVSLENGDGVHAASFELDQ